MRSLKCTIINCPSPITCESAFPSQIYEIVRRDNRNSPHVIMCYNVYYAREQLASIIFEYKIRTYIHY